MPTKKQIFTICSFCLGDFPDKELFIVSVPVNIENKNSHNNCYGTPCCQKCLNGKDKDRYIRILQYPELVKKKS